MQTRGVAIALLPDEMEDVEATTNDWLGEGQ
jgi:hypothetical protein